jgi:hypothetical protein
MRYDNNIGYRFQKLKGEGYCIVLLSDRGFPYCSIINEIDDHIGNTFKSDVKFLDFDCNSNKGSVGYGWFLLKYLYIPDDFRIEIEHGDRGHLNIDIYDPDISQNDNVWSCRNNIWNMIKETKGAVVDTSCASGAMRIQVKYLYDVLVNRDPQFYPIKYNVRAKTAEGQKYWIRYWEEHPFK